MIEFRTLPDKSHIMLLELSPKTECMAFKSSHV